MSFTESEFIAWITAGGASSPALRVGPGDDAAVLADGTVVSVDAFVEGVHFDPGTPLDLVARKALGAAISDVCAMGAVAELVFVSALLPPGIDGKILANGLDFEAGRLGVTIAGGDTNASPMLALAITVTGHCPSGSPWLRSGGRPGDTLVVSGSLGGSRKRRHLRPVPRRDIVRELREHEVVVHACMDISDGLLADLPKLCGASRVGATVRAEAIPIHDDAGGDLMAALGDGEDFELLLALPPGVEVDGLTPIGTLTGRNSLVLVRGGVPGPWPRGGFEHVF